MAEMKDNQSTQGVHPTHGPFVKEGLMVAFPLCFPGMTDPIPLEESRITALAWGSNGVLYGGTGGKGAHVFAGCFKGPTGAVWDLGRIDGALTCTGIACGKERLVAAVNGPEGSRIVSHKAEAAPDFDLLQEWSFLRRPYEELRWELTKERILDLVSLAGTSHAVGISEHHIFTIDIDRGECKVAGEIDSAAHLMASADGQVYGLDADNTLWRSDANYRRLTRKAVSLPTGTWDESPLVWTRNDRIATFYLTDSEGKIFSFSPTAGFRQMAQAPLAPVHCLAVIPDGRIYGFCGEDIAHLFVIDPRTSSLTDLGVAVSVIERRRYGYQFAAAAVNQDGHLFFGENDNLGHLWMYFPSIQLPE